MLVRAFVVGAITVPACAGTPPPAPKTPMASEAASHVLIRLPTPNEQAAHALVGSLTQVLVSRGYAVSNDTACACDVIVEMTMRIQQAPPGLIQTYVNGRPKIDYTANVVVSAQVDEAVVDTASVSYDPESPIPDSALATLVHVVAGQKTIDRALAASERRSVQAKALRLESERRQERERSEQQARRAAEARRQTEQAWVDADVTACRNPSSLTSCKRLQQFLVDYPAGPHSDEARQVLDDAEPVLDRLQKDENEWIGSGFKACRSNQGSDSCDGVEIYLKKHPGGLHADEARDVLDDAQARAASE